MQKNANQRKILKTGVLSFILETLYRMQSSHLEKGKDYFQQFLLLIRLPFPHLI